VNIPNDSHFIGATTSANVLYDLSYDDEPSEKFAQEKQNITYETDASFSHESDQPMGGQL
jgi:hypothetical protein